MAIYSDGQVGWKSGIVVPTIVTNGLILNLDAGNASSYPGTGTTWTDLSGQNNNGTLVTGPGNPGPTWSSTNGGTFSFDGVNDYVSNTTTSMLSNIPNFSMNIWFKITNTSLNNTIFSFGTGENYSNDILLGVYGNVLFAQVNNGADGSAYTTFTSTSWVNVHVVYDGTLSGNSNRLKLYLNGVLLNLTYSYTVPSRTGTTSRYGIGAYSTGNFNNFLLGNIGASSVYNISLSASEVTQNFNVTKTRFGL